MIMVTAADIAGIRKLVNPVLGAEFFGKVTVSILAIMNLENNPFFWWQVLENNKGPCDRPDNAVCGIAMTVAGLVELPDKYFEEKIKGLKECLGESGLQVAISGPHRAIINSNNRRLRLLNMVVWVLRVSGYQI